MFRVLRERHHALLCEHREEMLLKSPISLKEDQFGFGVSRSALASSMSWCIVKSATAKKGGQTSVRAKHTNAGSGMTVSRWRCIRVPFQSGQGTKNPPPVAGEAMRSTQGPVPLLPETEEDSRATNWAAILRYIRNDIPIDANLPSANCNFGEQQGVISLAFSYPDYRPTS